MSQFELFCAIFYMLDSEWEETHDVELGQYLSSANPKLFKDIGSASPDIYLDFCEKTPDNIMIKESYNIAENYLSTLGISCMIDAIHKFSYDSWKKCVTEYLQFHRAGENNT